MPVPGCRAPATCWLYTGMPRKATDFSYAPNAHGKRCSKNKEPLCFRMSSYKQLIMEQKYSVTKDCFPWFIFPGTIPSVLISRSQKAPVNHPRKGLSNSGGHWLWAQYRYCFNNILQFFWPLPPRKPHNVSQRFSLPSLFPRELMTLLPSPCWRGFSSSTTVVLIMKTNSGKLF